MIHLIQNYYADPNNMGFTLVIDKGRKDKDGKALYDTVGYCGSFEEVIYLLKRRVVNDRLKNRTYGAERSAASDKRYHQRDYRSYGGSDGK